MSAFHEEGADSQMILREGLKPVNDQKSPQTTDIREPHGPEFIVGLKAFLAILSSRLSTDDYQLVLSASFFAAFRRAETSRKVGASA